MDALVANTKGRENKARMLDMVIGKGNEQLLKEFVSRPVKCLHRISFKKFTP